MSPLLFNLYVEEATDMIKEKVPTGVPVHGRIIQMLKFADDIVIFAESKEDLKRVLNEINNIF